MDPALKFVVDVQNSEQIKRLTTDINQQRDAIANLNKQLQAGSISEAQFTAQALPMGNAIAKATRDLHALQAARRGVASLNSPTLLMTFSTASMPSSIIFPRS